MDERFPPPEQGVRRIPIHDRRRVRLEADAPAGGGPAGAPGVSEPPAEGSEAAAGVSDVSTEALSEASVPQDADGQPSGEVEPEVDPAEELRRARAEAAEHREDLQRLQAEFSNYRKRILKEQTEMVERASAGLVHRLLPVLDNFSLAVSAAEGTRDFERMLRGVEMVFGELNQVLASEGLEVIKARGHAFDPTLHEAALELPGDEDAEPVVAEVLRPGFLLRGRVLRPAMVKVVRRRAGGEQPALP